MARVLSFFWDHRPVTRKLEGRLTSLNVDENAVAVIAKRHAEHAIYKTAARQALGSINELVFHLRWMAEEQPNITVVLLEDALNEIPSRVLGYFVPLEKLEEWIRLAN